MKFNQNTSCAKLLCAKCQFSLYDCRFLQIIKSCLCVFLYYLINKKSLFSRCKSNSIPREISNKQWPTCVQYSTSRQEIVFSEECKNDGCNKIHCLCKAGTLFFRNFGSPKIISLLGIIVCNIWFKMELSQPFKLALFGSRSKSLKCF